MTTPVATPASLVPAFTIHENPDSFPEVIPLYKLTNGVPERIESVYMTIDLGAPDVPNDVYAIQYVDPSGYTIGIYPTPLLNYAGGPNVLAFLTWSRLGNDTAQLPFFSQVAALDNIRRIWANLRLPDLVLEPLAQVNLISYRDNGLESPDIAVSDAFVTVTRNAGEPAVTETIGDLVPLLAPVPLDEQGDPQLG